MTTYGLYLDHGPKRKKTMVHVIDLMGCVHNGPTTDQVLEETPAGDPRLPGLPRRPW